MKFLFAAMLFILFNACTPKKENTSTLVPMDNTTQEKNKDLIRFGFAEVVGKQQYDLIDSLFAPNIFDHGAFEGQEQGLAGFKKAVSEFLGTFSKIDIKIGDIIAEGDLVATRETWKVIRKSDNKELSGETMHWFKFKDGKVTDEWSKGWEWIGNN